MIKYYIALGICFASISSKFHSIHFRILEEDQQGGDPLMSYKDAIKQLADYLEEKSTITSGQPSLQERIAHDYLKRNDYKSEDQLKQSEIDAIKNNEEFIQFSIDWTKDMFQIDLIPIIIQGMLQDGMTKDQATKEAQNYGLTFITWRLLNNEEDLWKDFFDSEWQDEVGEDLDQDWVKEMEQEMEALRKEHAEEFEEFDALLEQYDQMINDGNEENDIKDVKIDEDEILKKNQNTSLDELIKNNSDQN